MLPLPVERRLQARPRMRSFHVRLEDLSGQVAAGAVMKARGLRIEAYNSSDKITDRSSRVVRLLTSLSLVENELAPKGQVRVYIRVKDPDGIILTNSNRTSFTYNGETMVASAFQTCRLRGQGSGPQHLSERYPWLPEGYLHR